MRVTVRARRASHRHFAPSPRPKENAPPSLCNKRSRECACLSWTRTTLLRPQRGEPGVRQGGKYPRESLAGRAGRLFVRARPPPDLLPPASRLAGGRAPAARPATLSLRRSDSMLASSANGACCKEFPANAPYIRIR